MSPEWTKFFKLNLTHMTSQQLTKLRLNAAFGRKLDSIEETRSLMTECLNDYKTIASKKAFMTRAIRSHVDFLKDVVATVTAGSGWYLGDFYTAAHVLHYSKELVMLQEIKDGIKQLTAGEIEIKENIAALTKVN